MRIRRADERGHFDHGWLRTWHTFSFGDYMDPNWVRFRTMRVLNEDIVAPRGGFPMHPHRDMEIITVVLRGELEHSDSLGNTLRVTPGKVQKMSAGSGIVHSERNPSDSEAVHLYQIWIFPDAKGLDPSFHEVDVPSAPEGWTTLASRDAAAGGAPIHQDALVLRGTLGAGAVLEHKLEAGRGAWLQVVSGDARLGEERLSAGDGAGIEAEALESGALRLTSENGADVLLFDLG